MRRALICGVSGQDGAYLAKFLIDKDYKVFGSSRNARTASFANLSRLGVRDRVACVSMPLSDLGKTIKLIAELHPDEIYNLSAQSSVAQSFQLPIATFKSIIAATWTLLEAVRIARPSTRIFCAASSECFGNVTPQEPSTELSPFRPRSPYGVAKAASFWEVANYRDAYGLFACNGVLFNHESPLRPSHYVIQKVVRAAAAIARGDKRRLQLGNLGIIRDWGWAPEYVEAMWAMLQRDDPDDFIIATGTSHSLKEFVSACFSTLDLDWRNYVDIDQELLRKTDIEASYACTDKANRQLGWKARTPFATLIGLLLGEALAAIPNSGEV